MSKALVELEDERMQIAQLKDKLEQSNNEESTPNHGSSSRHIEKAKQVEEEPLKHDSASKSTHYEMYVATLSVQPLQEMITDTVTAQYGKIGRSLAISLTYSKPYSKRIDALKMPIVY